MEAESEARREEAGEQAPRQRMVFSYVSRLHKKGHAYIVQELERAGMVGVVPSHGDILAHLFVRESCTMSELARLIGRSKSTSTVLVEKLEKHGYVQREQNPRDLRSLRVHLTEKGRAIRPAVDRISTGLNALLEERLTTEELDMLERLLARCVDEPTTRAPGEREPGA